MSATAEWAGRRREEKCGACGVYGYTGIKNYDVLRCHPDMVNGNLYCDRCWRKYCGSDPRCYDCGCQLWRLLKRYIKLYYIVIDGDKAKCPECAGVEVAKSAKASRHAARRADRKANRAQGGYRVYKCTRCDEYDESWKGLCDHWRRAHGRVEERPERKAFAREWIMPDEDQPDPAQAPVLAEPGRESPAAGGTPPDLRWL
eukprot:TRINITY_DN15554_c0_g1_i1.p1 TRINITY_DN15554_c0_g1~~TRINITY_DN15554_c0_g1_i1.p1  ORF type:complete len:229 (+),score=31.77 TRINITY_DN15554_c0_g1_i1:86-688(+)